MANEHKIWEEILAQTIAKLANSNIVYFATDPVAHIVKVAAIKLEFDLLLTFLLE